jgi:hypothetical protein
MWTAVPDITMHLQLRIFSLQYYTQRICAVIGDISTIQCTLYYKIDAKYSAHPTVYTMWILDPVIYNEIRAPHIQAPIFNWKYLRCNWRYLDNSMPVILQTWCQIRRTCSSLRYVKCGPDHIQCNCSSAYLGYNIQLIVSPLLLETCRQFNARYTAYLVPNTAHILQFTQCRLWSRSYPME